MSNRRREDPLAGWVPKTELGKLVLDGQISSIFEIFEEGYKIKEVQIVDALVPDLKDDVININLVQKQTDAGESSRFTALVAVGLFFLRGKAACEGLPRKRTVQCPD